MGRSSCERCWRMAGDDPDEYQRLLLVNACTPEQQAGDGATCPSCQRATVHEITGVCMVPGCRYNHRVPRDTTRRPG